MDDPVRFARILKGIGEIGNEFNIPVIYPIHPRSKKRVQEETCILGVPCVTLRDNTERPETLDVGSNMLSGTEPEMIIECAHRMLKKGKGWMNPFGDGRAAQRIVKEMED